MALARQGEVFQELPVRLRMALFQKRITFPSPFLEGLSHIAEQVFPNTLDPNSLGFNIQEAAETANMVHQNGSTYFSEDPDKPDASQIPDIVWEIFGASYDVADPAAWPETMSQEVKGILHDVWKMRQDPYLRQTDYASPTARFVFLQSMMGSMNEVFAMGVQTGVDEQFAGHLRNNVLRALLTIDGTNSPLERAVVQRAKRLDFFLQYEHDGYHWPLPLLHQLYDPNDDMQWDAHFIEGCGVPDDDDELLLRAVNIVTNKLIAEQHITYQEAQLQSLMEALSPVRHFYDYHPKGSVEIATFGAIYDFLDAPEDLQGFSGAFPQQADKFSKWLAVVDGHEDWETLPEAEGGPLADMMLARDLYALEYMQLLLEMRLDVTKLTDPEIHAVKAKFLRIRDRFMEQPVRTGQSEDLRTMFKSYIQDIADLMDDLSFDRPAFNTRVIFSHQRRLGPEGPEGAS